MNVTQDLGILHLITGASIVVQIVMGILAFASLLAWTYIFMKLFQIRRAQREADAFEREFWSGSDLVGLYQRASGGRSEAAGL